LLEHVQVSVIEDLNHSKDTSLNKSLEQLILDCGAGVLSNERVLLNYSIEQLCNDLRIHEKGLLGHFFCEILFLELVKIIKNFG